MKIKVDDIEIELLVGADPEIFVTRGNTLVSAHGMVPGTKENPHKVNKGAIQVDGMALEFNIDPANSLEEFVDNVNTVMHTLNTRIPDGCNLTVIPTAEFGARYIQDQPEIAKELGCSSDFNAYTGKENPKPNAEVPFRTAAGHIHIGWGEGFDTRDPEHMDLCCQLTKVLDLYLGVPSVLVDQDTKRRSLYGAAGAFRPKTYGLEYRVLSNFWLKSEAKISWAYQQTAKALTAFLGGTRVSDVLEGTVTRIVNTSNVGQAKIISKTFSLEVPNA